MKVYIEKIFIYILLVEIKKNWVRVYIEFIRVIFFEEWRIKGLGNKERFFFIGSYFFKRKVKYKEFMVVKIC